MTWLEAFILGVVQALTEFLPVSSSGHIELGKVILDIQGADNTQFSVVVHGATSLSTIVVFRREIGVLLSDVFRFRRGDSLTYIGLLALSALPVFIVGVFFKDEVEGLFSGNLVLVGSMLLVTAGLLLVTRFANGGARKVAGIGALIIGVAQSIAVLPGISRSGATISTALMMGIQREEAARFSFLMAIIPILGAALLEVKDIATGEVTGEASLGAMPLLVGFATSFLVGTAACRLMLTIVKRGSLFYFAFYCAIVGSLALYFGLN
jgi:undecaprenyl-diphosphatase